jgi:hypothetical protein
MPTNIPTNIENVRPAAKPTIPQLRTHISWEKFIGDALQWLADFVGSSYHELQRLTSSTQPILPEVWAFTNGQNAALVLGQSTFTAGTGSTTENGMNAPAQTSFDSSGNLWVADAGNHRVLEFTCTATSSCTNGNNAALVLGQPNFTSGTAGVTQSVINTVYNFTFDSSGNLWVNDELNNRILEYTCTATSSCVNGNNAALVLGQPNFTSGTAGVTQSVIHNPGKLLFDSSHNLWVTDVGNYRILEFTCTATSSCTNDNNAALELGQPNFTTGTPQSIGPNTFRTLDTMLFDSSKNLWVADVSNYRILEFTCTATSSCTNDNKAALVLGQPNFTAGTGPSLTRSGLAKNAVFNFDSSHNLWVDDRFNNRFLEFTCTETSSCVNDNNAALVLGQSSFTTNAAATTQSGLNHPFYIFYFDPSENLWIPDTGNNRELEFTCTATSSCTNGSNAALVLGQSSFATGTASTTPNGLSGPGGVLFDSSGNVWVNDGGNNRILEFHQGATAVIQPTSGPAGTNVSVSGSDFAASDTGCSMTSSPTGLISSPTCTVTGGVLSGSFTVASGASGTYTVTVTGTPTSDSASATFTVTTQVTMTVSYSVVGGGTPTAPVFYYVLNGASQSLTLTKAAKAVSVDAGSAWSVTPNPLGGSTTSQRWYSTQALTGTASATTIVFSFQRQYYLTMLAHGPGTVSPSSGWQNAGAKVTIKATANSGHKFKTWTGSGTGSYTGTSASHTINMNAAITETANFT